MSELPVLSWAVNLLLLQGLMGGFDTVWHHELSEDLPHRPGAALELRIHAVRALFYGVLFIGVGHLGFHGAWAYALATLVLVEVALTLWDFVVEDRTRKLPATERVTHSVLAINGGALFGLYGWQLAYWAALPTALTLIDLGWRGWLLTLFGVGVSTSGLRDAFAARRLAREPVAPNPFAGQPFQHVLVSGGTGFIGQALVAQMLEAGHAVTVLTRDPLRAAFSFGGRARCITRLDQLSANEAFDAVINLAGAPVVGPRWSAGRKQQLLGSRVDITRALAEWVARTTYKPAVWVQASAFGVYGVRDPQEALREDSAAGQGFMAELCLRWEAEASIARQPGLRQVVLRLGLVFGPGGALPPLLMPYHFGMGGKLGSGGQVMSWIHRDDVLALIATSLTDPCYEGVYNAVAPETISQAGFASEVGQLLGRPVWLHLPAAPIRALAGEMAELFLDGQRVLPARLTEAGFRFRFPQLREALRNVIGLEASSQDGWSAAIPIAKARNSAP